MTIVTVRGFPGPCVLVSGPHSLDDRRVVVVRPAHGRVLVVDFADVSYLASGPAVCFAPATEEAA